MFPRHPKNHVRVTGASTAFGIAFLVCVVAVDEPYAVLMIWVSEGCLVVLVACGRMLFQFALLWWC
jgi:hypothetical protein